MRIKMTVMTMKRMMITKVVVRIMTMATTAMTTLMMKTNNNIVDIIITLMSSLSKQHNSVYHPKSRESLRFMER